MQVIYRTAVCIPLLIRRRPFFFSSLVYTPPKFTGASLLGAPPKVTKKFLVVRRFGRFGVAKFGGSKCAAQGFFKNDLRNHPTNQLEVESLIDLAYCLDKTWWNVGKIRPGLSNEVDSRKRRVCCYICRGSCGPEMRDMEFTGSEVSVFHFGWHSLPTKTWR